MGWYTCLKCGKRVNEVVDFDHEQHCEGQDVAPTKGIYRCPVHGPFVYNLTGEVLDSVRCTAECLTLGPNDLDLVPTPCGLISPLAGTKDLDLDKPLKGIDDKTWDALRESITALRKRYEEAANGSAYGEKWSTARGNNHMYGATEIAQRKLREQKNDDAKVALDMFETIQKEKMREAMAEAGLEI